MPLWEEQHLEVVGLLVLELPVEQLVERLLESPVPRLPVLELPVEQLLELPVPWGGLAGSEAPPGPHQYAPIRELPVAAPLSRLQLPALHADQSPEQSHPDRADYREVAHPDRLRYRKVALICSVSMTQGISRCR